MAKKFVRGVTGVDVIEKLDKSLTNVNDLISDGQNTYVHTKKGKNELYYNITNSVNQVKSGDNTLTITKENDTISISNKSLATKQELANSVNKVESRDNTLTITKENDTISISNKSLATKQELATEKSSIYEILAQKQNKITTNNSICVYSDSTLRQLYTPGNVYSVTGGYLKTTLNYTNPTSNIYQNKIDFKFIVKINKNEKTVTFNLNNDDKTRFASIFSNYGYDNTVIISGLVFSLTDSYLTVSSPTTSDKNQVITFSDII